MALVVAALAVRLPFIDEPGLPSDITLFVAWSETAANQGLPALYARDDYNYAPVASYLFVAVGRVQRDVLGRPFATDSTTMRAVLKLPAIACDLAITVVLYLFLVRRASRPGAIAGALAYALNPAAIYDTVIWGQWDSLVVLPGLVAVICLIASRPRLAAVFLATAILVKFQAIVFVPLAGVVIARKSGLCALVSAALAGVATVAVLLVPVIVAGQLRAAVDVYVGLTSAQPWVANNAYNVWWLVNWFQTGSPTMTLEDSEALIGPISYKMAALVLFALAILGIVAALSRARLTSETISLAAAASVLSFFALAPEMHERYLIPAIPLLILAFEQPLQRWLVGVITVTVYLSLDWVLVSAEGVRWSVGKLATTSLLAVVNFAVLILVGVVLFHRAAHRATCDRRAWFVAAASSLLVAMFAGVTVLRWYLRDVRQ